MSNIVVPNEIIENKIFLIRGKKVILDNDLAQLYQVPTKRLNEQVKRNIKRFPDDFMIQLTEEELIGLRSQIATSKPGRGGLRYLPYAFTEQGVAMLSSVLNSDRAIDVNIQIMRTFIRLREMLLSYKELRDKIQAMEQKYDHQFADVFDAIKKLIESPLEEKPKRKIGFHRISE